MSQYSVKFDEDKRHGVYNRDGYKCGYCGHHDETKTGATLSIDHIDSRAGGGDAQNTKHSPGTNLITACRECNFAKQDKTPRQWSAYVKSKQPPEGGIAVAWAKIRRQAQKPIDIKRGEELAKVARASRASRASGASTPASEQAERSAVEVVKQPPTQGFAVSGPGVCHDEQGHFEACARLASACLRVASAIASRKKEFGRGDDTW